MRIAYDLFEYNVTSSIRVRMESYKLKLAIEYLHFHDAS